jgi:hypothetical protein
MDVRAMIDQLSKEISRLVIARDALLAIWKPTHPSAGVRRRRPMSPETKAKISEMMKKRWAQRKEKGHAKKGVRRAA